MAIDMKKMREKYTALQNRGQGGSSQFWKPSEGNQTIRIVPTEDGDPAEGGQRGGKKEDPGPHHIPHHQGDGDPDPDLPATVRAPGVSHPTPLRSLPLRWPALRRPPMRCPPGLLPDLGQEVAYLRDPALEHQVAVVGLPLGGLPATVEVMSSRTAAGSSGWTPRAQPSLM